MGGAGERAPLRPSATRLGGEERDPQYVLGASYIAPRVPIGPPDLARRSRE